MQEVLARVERLRQKVAQAPKRILEEDDDELRAALRAGFRDLQAELAEAEKASPKSRSGCRIASRRRASRWRSRRPWHSWTGSRRSVPIRRPARN